MPQNFPPGEAPRSQQEVIAVGDLGENGVTKPPQHLHSDDLEAARNCERSRQASFRSLCSSQSSFCSFKSVGGRFSKWGSFKSAISLTSFMSAKWDVTEPHGAREVAMVAPFPRAPKFDPKLEKKKTRRNDCTFLLILSTGILLALFSAAFALGLWF